MISRLHDPILALAIASCACAPVERNTLRATEPGFTGRVLHADGTPGSGVVVIISDPAQGDMLSTVRAGADGRFATKLRPATYAITATGPAESAYVPAANGARGPVEIRLDTSCHRVEGRIRTESRLAEDSIANFTRFSQHHGDVFGAAVGTDGVFKACVPAASYVVYPPQGFAARDAIADIPYPRVFDYRTDLQKETDRLTTELRGFTPESPESFVAALSASTRVLGLGESNHGTREFYVERTALATSLASKHGVRLVMIEAGYGEVLALDDYVNGAAVDVTAAVEGLGYWMWDTKTFLQTLEQLRDYNAPLRPDQRIHLVGFDVQDTSGAIGYLEQAGPTVLSAEERAPLHALASNNGKAWMTLAPTERAAVRATLDRIAATRAFGTASSKGNRVALAARSLLLRFDTLETTNQWDFSDVRDAGMARMVLEVIAIEPKNRAVLWGHLGHLGREYVVGLRSMGAHLAAALGDAYRVYGLFAVAGSARAWDYAREVGVVPATLRAPPPYSLEATLGARSGGAPVTYWTFARAQGEAARWLKGVRALRQFGAVFMPEGQEFTYWDLQSFDGAILFASVTPTDPTPTGERRAQPKQP